MKIYKLLSLAISSLMFFANTPIVFKIPENDPNHNNPLIDSEKDAYIAILKQEILIDIGPIGDFSQISINEFDGGNFVVDNPAIVLIPIWQHYIRNEHGIDDMNVTEKWNIFKSKFKYLLFGRYSKIELTMNFAQIFSPDIVRNISKKGTNLDLKVEDIRANTNPVINPNITLDGHWYEQYATKATGLLDKYYRFKVNLYFFYDERNIYAQYAYKLSSNLASRKTFIIKFKNLLLKKDNPYVSDFPLALKERDELY